jgi:hypothetical protein
VVSLLEGGYSLEALRECSVAYLSGLLEAAEPRLAIATGLGLEWPPCVRRKLAVRRTTLRLLPLCLAVSAAVHAEEAPSRTGCCAGAGTLPLFTELDLEGAVRENAPTDIDADTLDVKDKDARSSPATCSWCTATST